MILFHTFHAINVKARPLKDYEFITEMDFMKGLEIHSTPPITKKKHAEILLHYRWLFVKGNMFIGEWVHLVWLFSFVIANFSLNATLL